MIYFINIIVKLESKFQYLIMHQELKNRYTNKQKKGKY